MHNQLGLFESQQTDPVDVEGAPVRVRVSLRAKRLILQAIPPGLIEVVVPAGTAAKTVRAFVNDNDGWIKSARRELAKLVLPDVAPPEALDLPALGDRYEVRYRTGGSRGVRAVSPRVLVVGHDGSERDARQRLRRWLLARARNRLGPWLDQEAMRLGASPAGFQVRLQRTRWGSCSSSRRISLNAALLLVEPDLVRYLLVHELAHLRHMNHSRRFWAYVARFEPNWKVADRALGAAWRDLPAWLLHREQGA